MNELNLYNKKILLLGFGAVQKCILYYLEHFFNYNINNVFIVDKNYDTIYKYIHILKPNFVLNNIYVIDIDSLNFISFLNTIKFSSGDIIIDLTTNSNTYFFIKTCIDYNYYYVNTSIEDHSDKLSGTSIYLQHQIVRDLFKNKRCKSNILVEMGQNSGFINFLFLYSLNYLYHLHHGLIVETENFIEFDSYDKQNILDAIDIFKVGTMLSSEIDGIKLNEPNFDGSIFYNSWSVEGFVSEAFDKCELIYGTQNNYCTPHINNSLIDVLKTKYVNNHDEYKTLFLNELSINCVMNSICPIPKHNNEFEFVEYTGSLIHHGEMFELANYFGNKCPFISYVYKFNDYLKQNIINYSNNYKNDCNGIELKFNLHNNSNYSVFNNIDFNTFGFDSIGCTLFCQNNDVYYCGTILQSTDVKDNFFTPTIIQVMYGLLSGLSFILEDCNNNKGLFFPTDLNPNYIFNKSKPFYGKFIMKKIHNFNYKNLNVSVNKII